MPLDGVPELETWQGDSSEVFRRMCAGVSVRAGCPVSRVVQLEDGTMELFGGSEGRSLGVFDRCVFACPAPEARKMLVRQQSPSLCCACFTAIARSLRSVLFAAISRSLCCSLFYCDLTVAASLSVCCNLCR